MPSVEVTGARLEVEEQGEGPALLCLHGGWGRGAMSFDDAARELSASYRVIEFDRRGYGRSSPVDSLPVDYHRRAVGDVLAVLDALGLESAAIWGHSDGAIIGAYLAEMHPSRVCVLVLEAVHFHRRKSLEFFETHARDPGRLGGRTAERLADDHGDRWQTVVRMHSRAWLDLGRLGGDFYEGALERIECPVLVLHGAHDVHTPVAEVREVARRLRRVELEILEEGGHSPHSEPATARFCSERVARFLAAHSGSV